MSNVGSMGIESFTPVINPAADRHPGRLHHHHPRAEVVAGEIKTYPAMTLSLTYDHRALDGTPASRFLKDLQVQPGKLHPASGAGLMNGGTQMFDLIVHRRRPRRLSGGRACGPWRTEDLL